MENELKLFMVMLGCRPKGRFTEQHDIFFGIGKSLASLIPEMNDFWSEAIGVFHIDVWREVAVVDNFKIKILSKNEKETNKNKLFFINLGGYKENEFEEFHYKILTVAATLPQAIKKAKTTSFFKHVGFKGATSHIDDKFGIDVDDVYNVKEILSPFFISKYDIHIEESPVPLKEDILNIGYLNISKLT